jgi:hypothetical protein
MALLVSVMALGRGGPTPVIKPTTIIAPTTNFGQGENLNPGLYGLIYNYTSNHPINPMSSVDYSFANILNNVKPTYINSLPFNPVLVGTYVANTTNGINYGPPNNAAHPLPVGKTFNSDAQPLTSWLDGYSGNDGGTIINIPGVPLDGSTVHLLTGLTDTSPVYNQVTKKSTLLDLNGYVKVTPSMVNVPQFYKLSVDDGGTLIINGTTVIPQPGLQGPAAVPPLYPVIFTRAGLYTITIGYYD